jgi:hypothetical protein
MGSKECYEKRKERLLNDQSICKENRNLFAEFFLFQERKIKRINNLTTLDEGCYRTLHGYIEKFKNVNKWFKNKPWVTLTKDEIRKIYDDLEEGIIRNNRGTPFRDKRSYYNKIFKSKPFRLAGKDEIAREVLEYYVDKKRKEVKYVDEKGFKKLTSVLSSPEHLLLFWLAWDIGENVSSLLKLTRRDFNRQINSHDKNPEYLVNLPQDKLKRSRQSRSEFTLYPETVKYIDMILDRGKEVFIEDPNGNKVRKIKGSDGKYKKIRGFKQFVPFQPDDMIFNFEKRQASKIFDNAVHKTGVKSIPKGEKPTWKDLRSGMACHLFNNGWHSDEINLRLGHKISSKELDVYVSYLAANKKKSKNTLLKNNLEDIQNQLEESQKREKLQGNRIERNQEEIEQLKEKNKQFWNILKGMVTVIHEVSLDKDVRNRIKSKMSKIMLKN